MLAAALAATLMAGCGSFGNGPAHKNSVYQSERFASDETFSRLFDASVQDTCEAARRALLSQGYVINAAMPDSISGTKRFQPEGEVHVEISFTIVCVPEGGSGKLATAYVSALQDRYNVKRSANSTSLGVSAIGSISVPLSSTSESLVKVASETIPAGQFYDRFFALMQRLIAQQAIEDVPEAEGGRLGGPQVCSTLALSLQFLDLADQSQDFRLHFRGRVGHLPACEFIAQIPTRLLKREWSCISKRDLIRRHSITSIFRSSAKRRKRSQLADDSPKGNSKLSVVPCRIQKCFPSRVENRSMMFLQSLQAAGRSG